MAVLASDPGLDALHPEERAHIAAAAPSRRGEFAAGRVCARRLLRGLAIEDAPLLPDADRAPLWPPGVVGSITHSAGFCAVAVARAESLTALGLDVEGASSVRSKVWPRICRPTEIERLHAVPAERQSLHATLVFSAKEAVYKCLFPRTRVPLGFQDVEIDFAAADLDRSAGGSFRAAMFRDALPLARAGEVLEGRFLVSKDWVASGVGIVQALP